MYSQVQFLFTLRTDCLTEHAMAMHIPGLVLGLGNRLG
jgi:hypothetical protein